MDDDKTNDDDDDDDDDDDRLFGWKNSSRLEARDKAERRRSGKKENAEEGC